jgi:type I restriction enzyme M protein
VIGLPANLFTTTGIPVAILVFDRSREQGGANEKRKDVLFIDASREYTSAKTQNILEQNQIDKMGASLELVGCKHSLCNLKEYERDSAVAS